MLATMFTSTFTYRNTSTASAAVSTTLVISQIYGGGGNGSATYTHDYIEILNLGTTTVSLSGYSVQQASVTGNFTNITTLPITATVAPGKYFLYRGATGGAVGAALPTPDATGTINMGVGGGKVALVNGTTALGCGGTPSCTPAQLAQIVDLIGYGSTATLFEGSAPAPVHTNSTAAFRADNGCTDTDQNSSDFSVAAPAPRNSASPAACAPVPPSVASTIPANTSNEVPLDSNILITFTEPVTVTGTWFTISCATSGTHTASVSGGPTSYTLDPSADFVNNEQCTVTIIAAQVMDQDDTPETMLQDYSFTFTAVPPGGICPINPTTTIPAVQGTGLASPVAGQTVRVQGVVSAVFPSLSGFFMQDTTGDGNPATSDGLFIFNSTAVMTGNVVSVRGPVAEFNGGTQITTGSSVTMCGTATAPAPIVLDLPVPTLDGQEQYEGMLVSIPETITVDQNFFQGRFGQITVSAEGRVYNPTNRNLPGSPAAIAEANLNARRMFVLDDGRSAQNPNPIPYIGQDNTLRPGDTIAGLTGILSQGAINANTPPATGYILQPTVAPVFTRVNERTAAPDAVGGNVKVASFNVLNYFNTFNQAGAQCFPSNTSNDCRGANSALEFERQRTKIITAMLAIDADVVGLMEIENDGDGATSALQDLVNGLNAASAPGTYALVPSPEPGGDAIKVAMIYKPARVTRVGASQNYQVPNHPTYGDLFDRPPFAQTFSLDSNGEKFSVVVNHFKSKGCGTSGVVDTDQGDGQGCWNAKRTVQAQNLLNFINQIKASAADDDVLVIGDLNAYGKEDPITTLTSAGMVNEIERFLGTTAYSYVFDGAAGYLDHALTTSALSSQVAGMTEWHINADEPSVIDYNTEFKPQDLYTPTPYRSSDHDPVVIGLQLGGGLTPANFSGSSKTVNTTTVVAGSYLTYTLTISNSGQTIATFNITDTLNTNLQYIGSTPSMTQTGQQLTASGSIAGNQQKTYVITVRVNAAFAGPLNNSFSLSGDGTTRTFDAPVVTVTAAPTAANLSASTKTVNATAVTTGDQITYTLTVINSGQVATTYNLTDTLNASLTFVSASPPMNVSGQTVSASGIVAGGTSVVYTLVVEVNAGFSGTITNVAQVSGDGVTRQLTAPVVTVSLRKLFLPLILR
ncbi:MAG: ExeM/NucH family extracellular endonuclease [Herpetosiphonaceae bacterium]|nr:ExeM/NucH family extracellular endonuclease [Herpetosiphonaceae bacterium]